MNDDVTGPRATARARVGRGAILGGVAALALATMGVAPARAGCQIETVELPVRMIGSRATATVGINGTEVPLTVDSGAFFSFLTDAAAAQLALKTKSNPNLRVYGVTGKVDTRTTVVDKLTLLKGEIPRVEFIVGGNEPGAGTMGLMGRNILSIADAEYDLAHGVIRLVFPNDDCAHSNMAYWAGSTPVTELDLLYERQTRLPSIRTRVELNGHTAVALFDTGATTVLTRRAAQIAGIADADLKPAGSIYGAGQRRGDAWTAPLARFAIGGEAILDNRMRVADMDLSDADLLLGIDFFLSHRIYVSKQQSKVFLTYNGGPVFALANRGAAAPAVADAGTPSADAASLTADQYARRGAASTSRHDLQAALADLDRACALEPDNGGFLAQRGAIRQALGQRDQAREDLDRALERDPTLNDARLQRARLRYQAKDRAGANADLAVLDQTLPSQANLRLAMASAYLALDEPGDAVGELDQWLPAHPNDINRGGALNSRCWARALLGADLPRALDDCDDAVDGSPDNAAYLDSRGWVYFRMARYQKAIADFDRALGIAPKSAAALYGRGLARTRLGDATQGAADIAAAVKVQPEIERRMATMQGAPP